MPKNSNMIGTVEQNTQYIPHIDIFPSRQAKYSPTHGCLFHPSTPSRQNPPTHHKPSSILHPNLILSVTPTWAPSSPRHVGGDPFWNLPVNCYYHYYFFGANQLKNNCKENKIQSTCELWMNQRQLAKSSTKLIRRNSDDVMTTTKVVDVGLSNWAN